MMHELEIAPAQAEPAGQGAPWTLGDIAKAIGIVIGALIVFGTIAGLIAAAIAGDVDAIDDDPDALTVVLAASLPLEAAMIGVSYFFAQKHGLSWAGLGLRKPERGGLWLAPVLYAAGVLLVGAYSIVLDALGALPDSDLPDVVFDEITPMIVAGVLALVFAPIAEETFFRGFVFGGLNGKLQFWIAAAASGLLFGLAHVQNPGGFAIIPPIAGIGMIFAYGYYYSGSILPSIAAHFLFNLQAFAIQAATS
jgi:membrane protease YdiL (CAAX protease family)